TVKEWLDSGRARHEERPDSDRAADLMGGDADVACARRVTVDRLLAKRRDSVDVHRDTGRVRDLTQLRDRLYRTNLVVCPQKRHEGDAIWPVTIDRGAKHVGMQRAKFIDRQPFELGSLVVAQPLRGLNRRV